MSRPAGGEPAVLTGRRRREADQGYVNITAGQIELLADSVSTLLLAGGTGMGLLAAAALPAGMGVCLGLAALSVLLLLALRLRWWIGAVAATLPLVAVALSRLSRSGWGEWLADCRAFVLWLGDGMPQDPVYGTGGNTLALQFLLIFAVCALWFLLIRRLFWFPAVLTLWAGMFAALYWGSGERPEAGLYTAFAGMIVLAPRYYHGHLVRRDPGDRGISRGSMQLLAVPIALISVGAAALVTPANAAGWRSTTLVNLVDDLSIVVQGPFAKGGRYQSGFSMASAGYQPLESRLGGPVELDDTVVLTLELEGAPFLLRGSVEDIYTGSAWQKGAFDGDFRLDSLFWRRYRTAAFDRDKPLGGQAAQRQYQEMSDPVTYRMTYHSSRYTALFAAGQVERVRFDPDLSDLQAYFDLQGELFARYRLPAKQKVEVRTVLLRREGPGFDAAALALERELLGVEDKGFAQLVQRYTQLPESYSHAVRALAREVASQEPSPYAKALALEAWLGRHCTYTLEPETPPEGVDFVERFLETREGYCTYYASAMAVMARCQGIPARYVTGYGMEPASESGGRYRATNRTAHAWAELYFQGIGWVEFDPLSWSPALLPGEEGLAPQAEVQAPAEEREQPEESPPQDRPRKGAEGGEATLSNWMLAAALPAVLALVWTLRKVWRGLLCAPLRRFAPHRLLRRQGTPGAAMDWVYRDILRQLRLLGVEPQQGDTLTILARRADKQVPPEAGSGTMAEVCAARARLLYREEEARQEDLLLACDYHRGLELRLRQRLGDRRYLWARVLRR